MKNILKDLMQKDHKRYLGGLDIFRYIGPGLLVTVGFIDPGNWASNFAAGSEFGYSLLWVVTISTVMLIVLQHNVAHLGIVTGLCLSEAATRYTPKWISRPILATAVLASISTSLAEILGGAIALQMLFGIPIIWGAILTTVFVLIMLFTNSYKKIERAIKLRKEGNPIKIINELDFWNIIDNNLEPYKLSHNTSITNSIKDNTISLAANDINPYSLETAIDKLEHLPEDIQITFKEFLYEFLFHKHTNYALPAKEAQLLIDAGFLEEIDDIQALLQTYTRNEINKMLTSNEINGFKKNLKLEILINWCIENIPNEKIKEIFSPNYIVCTLFIKYKSIVRKIYRYLIRKYDTEDLFDGEKIIPVPKGAKYSMETCRFEFPDDDVTQLLNKYNANLLNKNNL